MTKVNRTRLADGSWRYDDDEGAEFVFMAWPTFSLESIDDFIDGRQCVQLPDGMGGTKDGDPVLLDGAVVAQLLEMRHTAFAAFKVLNFDLMLAGLDALDWACRFYGMAEAARPHVRARHKQLAANKDNASRPRSTICVDGKSLTKKSLIKRVAFQRDALGDLLPANDLWNAFYAVLEKEELDPERTKDGDLIFTKAIDREGNSIRTKITKKSFEVTLSRLRTQKKLI